jgi:2-polyprenyl-3-methyl-5-hydroxy-6-metoxy-1,4-benzoquinol methylase
MNFKFRYKFAKYPISLEQFDLINDKANLLYNKLKKIDLTSLKISEYNKRYLGDKIKSDESIKFEITKYLYLLCWCIKDLKKNIEDSTFVDFGGGHGLYSLLAKSCGFKNVIYIDIYNQSYLDSQIIGENVGFKSDHYINGDIKDLRIYLEKKNINIDVISSYDVLEHIYDIKKFFYELSLIKNNIILFFASAANDKNPLINYRLQKLHKNFEKNDREIIKGRKPTDTTQSLLTLRTKIIKNTGIELSNSEVDFLAKNTRGLLKDKIEQQAIYYSRNKELLYVNPYKTNTCDPLTGNWFENLINQEQLKTILFNLNYRNSTITNGYYDRLSINESKFKLLIKYFLNISISLLNKNGIFISPFYCLLTNTNGLKK